jgi:RNA polymerase sigma-70 factor (ECF subfamily)
MEAMDSDREELVRTHLRGVWRYLRFLGCDRALADDLTQETFVVFLRKPFTFVGDKATSGYLRGIARFVYLEAKRQRADLPDTQVANEVFGAYAGPTDGDDYLDALRECEQTLADRTRQAVRMHYGERLTQAQVAERLGMQENGVKTMLQRARQHLRECIERRLP